MEEKYENLTEIQKLEIARLVEGGVSVSGIATRLALTRKYVAQYVREQQGAIHA